MQFKETLFVGNSGVFVLMLIFKGLVRTSPFFSCDLKETPPFTLEADKSPGNDGVSK